MKLDHVWQDNISLWKNPHLKSDRLYKCGNCGKLTDISFHSNIKMLQEASCTIKQVNTIQTILEYISSLKNGFLTLKYSDN